MPDEEQDLQSNPETLPLDFFSKPSAIKSGTVKLSNPETLPLDFDFNGNNNPAAASGKRRVTGQFGERHPILSSPVDFLEGVGSGVTSTARGLSQIVHKVIPGIPELPEEFSETPDSNAAALGKLGEQAAEFAVPMGAVSKLVKSAPAVARLGAEALAAGGTSFLQSGGSPAAAAESAGTVGLLGGAGAALPAVAKAAGVPLIERIANASPRPLSQEAINLAKKYGIPLTRGMEGGSKTVQAIEKMLGHTVAPDLYEALMENAQQGVRRGAADLAGGYATDRFAAGDATLGRLTKTASELEQNAQDAYRTLEKFESDPANTKTITTGMRPSPSGMVDAAGKPVMVPETVDVPLPVDVKAAKLQLAPIRDKIMQQLPVAQQQYSKGLHAIQQLLAGPDVVPASVAEANLSAIKQIQREAVDGRVKMLAGRVLDALSPAVDRAVAQAGPDATDALATGRHNWKIHSQILDIVDGLSGDITGKSGQTAAADRLLRPADASYPLLSKVLAVSPESADDLGQAFLGRVFKKASTGELTNPTEAANLWNDIGPRTKAALFTRDQREDINAFMDLAKRVNENPNPSGTGIINSLLKLGILVTHPVKGAAAIGFGRKAAQILYEPQGAAALRTMLQSPTSREASRAYGIVKALAAKEIEGAPSEVHVNPDQYYGPGSATTPGGRPPLSFFDK